MDLGSLLLGLALLLLVAFVVARPILERQDATEIEISRADQLVAERESLLTTLRDLDFDYATGKISEEDYVPQRAQLVAQGVAVLRQLDALGVVGRDGAARVEDEVEQAIAARRKPRAAQSAEAQIETEVAARRRSDGRRGATCPHCGAAANGGDRFCPKCGQALAITCPTCGHPAQPEDKFCAKCGTRLQPVEAAG